MTSTVHNALKTIALLAITYMTGFAFFKILNQSGMLIISASSFVLFIIQFGCGMVVALMCISIAICAKFIYKTLHIAQFGFRQYRDLQDTNLAAEILVHTSSTGVLAKYHLLTRYPYYNRAERYLHLSKQTTFYLIEDCIKHFGLDDFNKSLTEIKFSDFASTKNFSDKVTRIAYPEVFEYQNFKMILAETINNLNRGYAIITTEGIYETYTPEIVYNTPTAESVPMILSKIIAEYQKKNESVK